jgi:CheY-like chemotaxis protein
MQDTKPIILYAEDDQDDFEATRDALHQLTDKFGLHQARNGQEAIDTLEKGDVKPCLVVLDLNMPVMGGKDVLVWLKDHQVFRELPTMILTTSSREEDIKLCQSLRCTFFRKPTLYRDLLHIVQIMLQMCQRKSGDFGG